MPAPTTPAPTTPAPTTPSPTIPMPTAPTPAPTTALQFRFGPKLQPRHCPNRLGTSVTGCEYHQSEAEAKQACKDLWPQCTGIYMWSCDRTGGTGGGVWYLCADNYRSSYSPTGSCLWEMEKATTEFPTSAPTLPHPTRSPTTPAPSVSPTTPAPTPPRHM